MHRIDADGHQDNLFTNGNPQTGTPATVVDAAWLNGVQEDLISLIEAAGLSAAKGNYHQILAAVQGLGGAFEKWAPDDTDTGVANTLLNGTHCIAFSGSSSGAVWSGWVPSGPTGLDLVPAVVAMMDADGGGNVKLDVEWYVVPPGADYSVASPTHTASVTLAAPSTAGSRWEPDLSDLALPSSKRGTAYSEIKIKIKRDVSVDGNASAAFCLHRFGIRPVLAS